jgi:hypothetical protein
LCDGIENEILLRLLQVAEVIEGARLTPARTWGNDRKKRDWSPTGASLARSHCTADLFARQFKPVHGSFR